MLDFMVVSTRVSKKGALEVYPKFIVKKSSDLMIRGGDFYAVWLSEQKRWSTDQQDAIDAIDRELDIYAREHKKDFNGYPHVMHLWDAETGMIDRWYKYCQKQMNDNYHMLDEKIIFSNNEAKKRDYASKRLDYPLKEGRTEAYDKLMSTLYSEEERRKIEWAIGSIVTGDSKKIQKFLVLYGSAGTGKSTILNIIQNMFEGYYSVFDARALGSSSNSFALEAFKSNPLIAIQHDGDLSRIEDNTRLNSLVSHEMMTVNEKFKTVYSNRFKAMLLMGTNKPVKITDAKSGLIRRLIDVSPTGQKLPVKEYHELMKRVQFELGAIAWKCKDVYLEDPGYYDTYIPISMLGASNDFFNFVEDSYPVFQKEDKTTLKAAWEMYKTYNEMAKVAYPYSMRAFKEELKNYFKRFNERAISEDGTRVRNQYEGFLGEKFEMRKINGEKTPKLKDVGFLDLKPIESIFDITSKDYPAQYATSSGIPEKPWSEVGTVLGALNTSKLHYVKVPENHIVIDFDIPDRDGNKCLALNIEEARKFPPTYAELSKSGQGIHLHYIYQGDPTRLSRVYNDKVEVKVFTGNSSLRRLYTKSNGRQIATINSGLPLKGEKMVNIEGVKSERKLRELILRNLNKEIHPATKPSIDFIFKLLEDAYNSGLKYDVTTLRNAIFNFASDSTHQADYCMKLVAKMKFKSDDPSETKDSTNRIVFYDIEVFPNLFLVNWKYEGEDTSIVRMINPKPSEIEELVNYRLVGFNNRRYDNHILYARMLGYDNAQIYDLSQKIIEKSPNCFFSEAYNLSYTDIYDYSSKKQSLKKWEIELGIHHKELGLPWDQPVPEDRWNEVAEYCDNDVLATEAVFHATKSDFTARKILAELTGGSVNDSTNSLSTKFIFQGNKHPQDQFNYRFMGDSSVETQRFTITDKSVYSMVDDKYTVFTKDNKPIFPGYEFSYGKSTYREEEVGEGGYVYAEPGIHYNVALLDVASMHPSSVIAENLFGDIYTKRFEEVVQARLAIKHKDHEKAKKLLNGVLGKYLDDPEAIKGLAGALKIVINSIYGLTSAKFDTAFRDIRNKDNIVAKRGALFMINLKHEVQKKGFTVAHIKTDSIKIPNATPKIIQFVTEYGEMYGYTFEHEATYEKMCLVNDAVYIAKYATKEHAEKLYGYSPAENVEHGGEWTATGTQFAVPYVFKKLFSKEPIEFKDLCETKSVNGAIYLDFNEDLPDISSAEKEKKDRLFNEKNQNKRKLNPIFSELTDEQLDEEIAEGHCYQFVGRVGQFCPIISGKGGGVLTRKGDDGRYSSVTGTKGYRWMESEVVEKLSDDIIDRNYYSVLVDDAIETISKYGDFEQFASEERNIPPWEEPDEPFGDTQTPFDVR